jgi:hypothetical protein
MLPGARWARAIFFLVAVILAVGLVLTSITTPL